MFNSSVLEVAIGLVFCYAAVALLASSVTEAIASAPQLRARSRLAGMKCLVNDPRFTGLALKLYNYALISPRGDRKASTERELKNLPVHVASAAFATAFIDTLQTVPGDVTQLKSAIDQMPDAQLRQLLQGMYARSSGLLITASSALFGAPFWFDLLQHLVELRGTGPKPAPDAGK
jgi:hypothetical protein